VADAPLVAEWQRITHLLLNALDAELAGLGLTPGEVNALACFGDRDAMPVRELIGASGQRPSTLTGVIDRLERRKLLTRKPDPGDRRALLAVLTARGRTARSEVQAAFATVEARVNDREAVRRALAAVDAALS
jgi:DNA-binding MarR family transcriptional regulator